MPTTPKRAALPFAAQEVNAITNTIPPSIKCEVLQQPVALDVAKRIGECSIVHLACHGQLDPNPSHSGILFSDWETNPFTVIEMAQNRAHKAEFAYISACHAANTLQLDLLDEAIHIAGACQLAGFPSVIGTMWQVPDIHSARVAELVYGAMLTTEARLDTRKAASALHFALRKVRAESQIQKGSKIINDPMAWAPYIHFGA
jgi:CHAT domain-containing protein